MRNLQKEVVKFFFGKLSIVLACYWPSKLAIYMMRKANRVQLSLEQILVITDCIRNKPGLKLLVFSLGNDSAFWAKLNRGGMTVFIEDNKEWIQKIKRRFNYIDVFHITYNTTMKNWKKFLTNDLLLESDLPNNIEKEEWDVILVDGPNGNNDDSPGRMKSIYLASKLIKQRGDVFIHDCNREVEDVCSNHYFGIENLQLEIKAPVGFLRHYKSKPIETKATISL